MMIATTSFRGDFWTCVVFSGLKGQKSVFLFYSGISAYGNSDERVPRRRKIADHIVTIPFEPSILYLDTIDMSLT